MASFWRCPLPLAFYRQWPNWSLPLNSCSTFRILHVCCHLDCFDGVAATSRWRRMGPECELLCTCLRRLIRLPESAAKWPPLCPHRDLSWGTNHVSDVRPTYQMFFDGRPPTLVQQSVRTQRSLSSESPMSTVVEAPKNPVPEHKNGGPQKCFDRAAISYGHTHVFEISDEHHMNCASDITLCLSSACSCHVTMQKLS